jgi:hypothetical protein
MNTNILEDTDSDLRTDDNDNEEYAHYAESASVTEGYIMGTPVITICGIVFVPSRDPEKLRLCPICKKIIEALFLNNE